MDDFNSDQTYDFERQGSFGVFQTEWSFPLEYFMVSFKPDEIKHLTLAKRLKPSKKLNFDMLLQRDIDEERIEKQMEPYLQKLELKKKQDSAEGAIFFPPILAAVVPVDANDIVDYYESEKLSSEADKKRLVREWHGHFRTTHMLYPGVDAITLTQFNEGGDKKNLSVKRDPVKFEARLAGDDGSGIRLVVIDGQHRLVTLTNILSANPGLLKNMSFPVCIVYAPLCTEAYAKKSLESGESIPKIHEIFRKLFLDVNRNAERVSGHFEHLLNDVDASAIASRQFCKHVLEKYSKNGLAQIEWNVRNNKESKTVTRNYSLTSIGVITPELDAHLSRHFEFLLKTKDLKDGLFDEEDEVGRVNFQKLTLRQKPIIEEQVKQNLVPLLDAIFFKTKAYEPLRQAFSIEIDRLGVEEKSAGKIGAIAVDVRAHLLDYADFSGEKNKAAKNRLVDFEDAYLKKLGFSIDGTDRPIVTRTIFQKAVFEALGELTARVKSLNPSTEGLATAISTLLDIALQDDCAAFSSSRTYLQYLVYTQKRMNQGVEARRSIACLIVGWLRSPNSAQKVVDAMELNASDASVLATALNDLGLSALRRLLSMFGVRRRAAFVKGFANDLSIPSEERNEFQDALLQKETDIERVQRGELDESKISKQFDEMVDARIHPDLIDARDQLKKYLSLDVELVAEGASGNAPDFDE